MAKNEVLRDADHLSLPVPNSTGAGAAVIVGSLVGVTQTGTGPAGEPSGGNPTGHASVWLKGAHKLAVTGAVTVGQPVFIPPAGGALTATVGANTLFGHALQAAGAGTNTITVRVARV